MSIYISASSIIDYLKCEKIVDFRINSPEKGLQNENMIVGTMVHQAIEKFWNSRDKGINDIKSQLAVLGFTSTIKKKAVTSITNFYDNYALLLSDKDLVEHRFRIKLHDDVFLVGKMDRVSDDGIIYDWKTAFRPPDEIETDPQFIIYYTAYLKLFNKQPLSVLGVYLMQNKVVPYVPNQYYIDLLYNTIIPRMESDIRRKELPKSGRFKGVCDSCIFKKACFEDDDYVVENKNSFI